MGIRGRTGLLSPRLSLEAIGRALLWPAWVGTGCQDACFAEGYGVNITDLGLGYGVWCKRNPQAGRIQAGYTDTQIVDGVGWDSHSAETRSNELDAGTL